MNQCIFTALHSQNSLGSDMKEFSMPKIACVKRNPNEGVIEGEWKTTLVVNEIIV